MTSYPAVRDYAASVDALHAGSRGLYGGPAVGAAEISERFASTAGLDTNALRASGRNTRGSADMSTTNYLWPLLRPIVQIAGRELITQGVGGIVGMVLKGLSDADEVEKDSNDAGNTIDTIEADMDAQTAFIARQLKNLIDGVVAKLSVIDSVEHPAVFAQVVEIGAGLIDQAASILLGAASDRDTALHELLEALTAKVEAIASCEQRCPAVLETEDPAAQEVTTQPAGACNTPQPVGGGSASGGGGAGGGGGGTGGGGGGTGGGGSAPVGGAPVAPAAAGVQQAPPAQPVGQAPMDAAPSGQCACAGTQHSSTCACGDTAEDQRKQSERTGLRTPVQTSAAHCDTDDTCGPKPGTPTVDAHDEDQDSARDTDEGADNGANDGQSDDSGDGDNTGEQGGLLARIFGVDFNLGDLLRKVVGTGGIGMLIAGIGQLVQYAIAHGGELVSHIQQGIGHVVNQVNQTLGAWGIGPHATPPAAAPEPAQPAVAEPSGGDACPSAPADSAPQPVAQNVTAQASQEPVYDYPKEKTAATQAAPAVKGIVRTGGQWT